LLVLSQLFHPQLTESHTKRYRTRSALVMYDYFVLICLDAAQKSQIDRSRYPDSNYYAHVIVALLLLNSQELGPRG